MAEDLSCLPECCCKPCFFYFLGIEIPNWNIFSQKFTRLPLVNTLKNRTLFECNFTLNSRSRRKWVGKVFGTCRATQPPWQFETRLHIIPEPQCTFSKALQVNEVHCHAQPRDNFEEHFDSTLKILVTLWKCRWSYMWCTDNYDAASKLIIKKWQLSSKIIENNGHMTLQVGLHT